MTTNCTINSTMYFTMYFVIQWTLVHFTKVLNLQHLFKMFSTNVNTFFSAASFTNLCYYLILQICCRWLSLNCCKYEGFSAKAMFFTIPQTEMLNLVRSQGLSGQPVTTSRDPLAELVTEKLPSYGLVMWWSIILLVVVIKLVRSNKGLLCAHAKSLVSTFQGMMHDSSLKVTLNK